MTDWSRENEDLRRALRERPAGDTSLEPCPPPERLEAAALDRCPGDEFNRILDHTVDCAACAAGWRIARSLRGEEGAARVQAHRYSLPTWALAAAALLVVGVGVTLVPQLLKPTRAPVYRSNDLPEVRSEIEDGSALPRDGFLLRWSCDLGDAVYSVRVMNPNLTSLASADHLEQEEFLVPQETLSALEPGDVVLWRVEAFHPDGQQVPSAVFSVRLE